MNVPQTATVLAIIALVIVGATLLLLFFVPVPEPNANTLQLLLGAVLAWGTGVFGYYYGSSKSSQSKDDTISSMAKVATGTGSGMPGTINTTTTRETTGAMPPLTGEPE